MQEKPLMTKLQSAYPNKFHNQFIFSTNFVPFHLKETSQSITVNNLEPVLTGITSLKIDENA